jgi:Fe-Mn family superoxide dismutase
MEVTKKTYQLPALRFGYKDLEPFMSEEQLTLHHTKHHAAYATGANAALDKLDKARKEGTDADQKGIMKELSFNVGGFILHNRFWENLAPVGKGGDSPGGKLGDAIVHEFGSFERFKKEFTQVASSAEGSGWAVLTYCRTIERPMIMQVEKHNVNAMPGFKPLLVLDVWEHAYYVDYRNLRPKYIEAFWNHVDWGTAQKRFDDILNR